MVGSVNKQRVEHTQKDVKRINEVEWWREHLGFGNQEQVPAKRQSSTDIGRRLSQSIVVDAQQLGKDLFVLLKENANDNKVLFKSLDLFFKLIAELQKENERLERLEKVYQAENFK